MSFIRISLCSLPLLLFSFSGIAQSHADPFLAEEYARMHLAYTSPMQLGLSETEYARCIRVQDFTGSGQLPRHVVLNGVAFYDDGSLNDLEANDGILTSREGFTYSKGAAWVPVGEYRDLGRPYFICDERFSHHPKVPADKFKIIVRTRWVPCSEWPEGYRQLCLRLCWPFTGSLQIEAIEVVWETF